MLHVVRARGINHIAALDRCRDFDGRWRLLHERGENVCGDAPGQLGVRREDEAVRKHGYRKPLDIVWQDIVPAVQRGVRLGCAGKGQ